MIEVRGRILLKVRTVIVNILWDTRWTSEGGLLLAVSSHLGNDSVIIVIDRWRGRTRRHECFMLFTVGGEKRCTSWLLMSRH